MKVYDANGVETTQLAPTYTKKLRDVYTLEFKTEADAEKLTVGVKEWIKKNKTGLHDKLSIRSKKQGLKLSVEITFGTYSDNLVQNFNAWLNANAVNVNATYQRVTAEYKTKVIKDKKTNQLVKQEKKKPNSTAVDPLSGKDQWSSALYMVNRLKNRFSDELHVAATIFIDYLVQQFSRVAIVNCRTVDKKARIYVKHILDNANQIELLPLVSHFKSYKTALKTHTLNMKNKANGTTENDVEDEKEKIKVKKHHFSYCVFGVCKQVIDDLNRENPNAGYDKILISSV